MEPYSNTAKALGFNALANVHNSAEELPTEAETIGQTETEKYSPFYSDGLISRLPNFIREPTYLIEGSQNKTVFAFASLVAASGILPNVWFVYGNKINYPNLYGYLFAGPGTGKGYADFARDMVKPIHDKILTAYRAELLEYKTLAKEEKEKVKQPLARMLLIPANATKPAFIERLSANGGAGIIFETEADTLVTALKSKHGGFTDLLRAGFHHETISCTRKAEGEEYTEISKPKISVFLTSTPNQLKGLGHETENGFITRFLFLSIPEIETLGKPYLANTTALNDSLKAQGLQLLAMYEHLKGITYANGIRVIFPEVHSNILHQFCETVFQSVRANFANNEEIKGAVTRLLLIAHRIACILTLLDAEEKGHGITETIEVSEYHIETALQLITVHSEYLYQAWELIIPTGTGNKRNARKSEILRLHAEGKTQNEIAQQVEKSQAYVSMVINGKK